MGIWAIRVTIRSRPPRPASDRSTAIRDPSTQTMVSPNELHGSSVYYV